MTRAGIEPCSPGPLANTLVIRLMAQFIYVISNLFPARKKQNRMNILGKLTTFIVCTIEHSFKFAQF